MKHLLILLALASPAAAQDDFAAYAAKCAALIAPIPDFNCGDGVLVPITVNGQTPTAYEPDMTCDNPAVLDNGTGSDGQCVPGSRILDLSTDTAQITVMCRQKNIRTPIDALEFNEIDIVAHNPTSGATCWFQAEAPMGTPIDGSHILSPNAQGASAFWNPVKDVVAADCGGCHDNDPAMYSPFVGQVWDQVATNPLGMYYHVGAEFGFGKWPLTMFDMRDNTCLGCHRIGVQETCGNLSLTAVGMPPPVGADEQANIFPGSHYMPPFHGLNENAWNGIYLSDWANLQSCCTDPTQPMCNPQPIPSLPTQ